MARVTYADVLREAWQAHSAPRATDAPTVISTFAGCGGSSLGYSMAGFRELYAVEWDNHAVEVFQKNFPHTPVWHGDIAKVSVADCLAATNLRVGELDVFDGSPPCQGFSQSGKRQMSDERNQLFREFVRLLRGLQPKMFVMENVAGMVEGKMKLIFADAMRELKASGYRVSTRLLNAMYFNVPQTRERMIFIGVREDLPWQPSHPLAQTRPITVRQALVELPNPDDSPKPKLSANAITMMRQCKPGISLAATHHLSNYYSWIKADWNRPCKTIHKTTCFGGFSVWHPDEDRGLTAREIARLGSWPDAFQFTGDFPAWIARIGNSVPPLFMRAIALHIRQILEQ